MSVIQWNSWGLKAASISESHLGNDPHLEDSFVYVCVARTKSTHIVC